MKNEDKIEILKKVLADYGLSLEDARVKDFFFRKRKLRPEEFIKNASGEVEFYTYSPHVKPVMMNLLPSQFENSSYGPNAYEILMDWYLYENSSKNSLVWDNIGNPKFDIVNQFVKSGDCGCVRMSLDGKFFNGEDGNHRLLTIMINYFLEKTQAKSLFELSFVNQKYKMTLPVSRVISGELNDLLSKESLKFESNVNLGEDEIYPALAREYRTLTYASPRESYYMVEYFPKNDTYMYDFNGETFIGTEQELISWLKAKQKNVNPVMKWENSGRYYVSCNNQVCKSFSKSKIDEFYEDVQQSYNTTKHECGKFLEVLNIDSNTYEIKYPGRFIEDEKDSKQYARLIQHALNSSKNVFLCKLTGVTEKELREDIDFAFKFSMGYHLIDLHYENLTQEEFFKIKELLQSIDSIYEKTRCHKAGV